VAARAGTVDCPQHGRTPYSLLCVHLRSGERRKYFAAPACEHGPAQAWCDACDKVVAEQRGWDDISEAHADFNVFCTNCYKTALRRHSFVSYSQGSDDDCEWGELGAPDE
jgi:hypothetical protein